ncbi:hypothetical protein [Sanyastnella coralliicola]|uniref:hypothetical protein n=1 Tax=Sanyastnella coralliicola TaxID=3069118 RepID=UPI0027BA956D|nr:hypothetical protein [Longitalea sp. SCSIO 12813]
MCALYTLKFLSYISLLIGATGIALLIWFECRFVQRYQDLAETGEIITLFKYGFKVYSTLLSIEGVGLICGALGYYRGKLKLGLIGAVTCLIGIIVLLISPM